VADPEIQRELATVNSEVAKPNQSLQLTAGRRDNTFYFYEKILDPSRARDRQR
jgi:hypothetical protein